METKDMLTLIGICFTFVVGATGLVIGIINSRKTIYINSITNARIKYIQDIRNSISDYCGLFYRYKILYDANPVLSNEKLEILRHIDKLKYQILLYLDPGNKTWDSIIIQLLEDVRNEINDNPDRKIQELIRVTQYLLKLEWEGAKKESKRGPLSEQSKEKTSKKYFDLYLISKAKDASV